AASPDDFWAVLVEGRPDDGRVARALAQYDFILLAGGGPFQPRPGAPLALRAPARGSTRSSPASSTARRGLDHRRVGKTIADDGELAADRHDRRHEAADQSGDDDSGNE